MCGADYWTDHRLIISKLKFHIQSPRRPRGKKASRRLNTSRLLLESVSQKLSEDLDSKLKDVTFNHTDINENWSALRDVVYQTSLDHLGPSLRKYQDWFDENNEEIQDLLEKKNTVCTKLFKMIHPHNLREMPSKLCGELCRQNSVR